MKNRKVGGTLHGTINLQWATKPTIASQKGRASFFASA